MRAEGASRSLRSDLRRRCSSTERGPRSTVKAAHAAPEPVEDLADATTSAVDAHAVVGFGRTATTLEGRDIRRLGCHRDPAVVAGGRRKLGRGAIAGAGVDGDRTRRPGGGSGVRRSIRRSVRHRIEWERPDGWDGKRGGRTRLVTGIRPTDAPRALHPVDVPELGPVRRRRGARERCRHRRDPDGHMELRRQRRQCRRWNRRCHCDGRSTGSGGYGRADPPALVPRPQPDGCPCHGSLLGVGRGIRLRRGVPAHQGPLCRGRREERGVRVVRRNVERGGSTVRELLPGWGLRRLGRRRRRRGPSRRRSRRSSGLGTRPSRLPASR